MRPKITIYRITNETDYWEFQYILSTKDEPFLAKVHKDSLKAFVESERLNFIGDYPTVGDETKQRLEYYIENNLEYCLGEFILYHHANTPK